MLYSLLLLILSSIYLNLPKTHYHSQDYTVIYYPYVTKAENYIVDGQFEEALTIYQKAFVAVPYVPTKDYNNALICSIRIGNKSLAFRYMDSLTVRGYSTDQLRSLSTGFDVAQEWPTEWEYFLAYKSKQATISQISPLDNLIDSLLTIEKMIQQEIIPSTDSLQQELWKIFRAYCGKYGYTDYIRERPDEKPPKDEFFLELLLLSVQDTDLKKDILSWIIQQVQLGYFSPVLYAYFFDRCGILGQYDSFGSDLIYVGLDEDQIKCYYLRQRTPDHVQTINHNRAQIGIASLNEARKLFFHFSRNISYKVSKGDKFVIETAQRIPIFGVPSLELQREMKFEIYVP